MAAGLEHLGKKRLGDTDDIFLVTEAHLDIYLGELRLTVGTKVFVAETFGDLEIAVKATHHQQLFEKLRRLGKGVEFAFMNT